LTKELLYNGVQQHLNFAKKYKCWVALWRKRFLFLLAAKEGCYLCFGVREPPKHATFCE
jgi:hypothetical protein